MKVLMLGWEFPPFFAGGVGTVCHALTKTLCAQGHQVTYIMPKGPEALKDKNKFLNLKIAESDCPSNITIKKVDTLLTPYGGYDDYSNEYNKNMNKGSSSGKLYGQNLLLEVERFAEQALAIALQEDFDVIHAHDWTTFLAGIKIKEATGKPLLVHIHITEFDKSGGLHADPRIYEIEKLGMDKADIIFAISNLIKNRCINNYFQPESKIRIVYNGIDLKDIHHTGKVVKPYEKIVLTLGRVTLQKGPDYFIEAAKKVIDIDPDVKFVMAGSGDMLGRMIEKAAALGIGDKIIFTGFVNRKQGDQLYKAADVFVMPSVSEPFGIVPLEAMNMNTPVIISRQSGISEILHHALKVDFWDVNDLANKMLASLHYRALHNELRRHGKIEIQSLTWDGPARDCVNIYQEAINMVKGRRGWYK